MVRSHHRGHACFVMPAAQREISRGTRVRLKVAFVHRHGKNRMIDPQVRTDARDEYRFVMGLRPQGMIDGSGGDAIRPEGRMGEQQQREAVGTARNRDAQALVRETVPRTGIAEAFDQFGMDRRLDRSPLAPARLSCRT